MYSIRKHPIGTIIAICIVLFAGLHIFYYEHTGSPTVLAEKLVQQDRPAKSCFLFRTFDIWFRPTTYELQMRCVREYAELAKDPTACELLLPSDYGISCINQSIDLVFRENQDKTAEHVKVDIDTDCNEYTSSKLKKDYCVFSKTHLTKQIEDCESIENEVVKKACILKFEVWEKYPELRDSSYFGKAADHLTSENENQ